VLAVWSLLAVIVARQGLDISTSWRVALFSRLASDSGSNRLSTNL